MADKEKMKLLPCPFCGSAAEHELAMPNYAGAHVGCSNCDEVRFNFQTDEDAIAAWNTRTPDFRAIADQCAAALRVARSNYIAEIQGSMDNAGFNRLSDDEIAIESVVKQIDAAHSAATKEKP